MKIYLSLTSYFKLSGNFAVFNPPFLFALIKYNISSVFVENKPESDRFRDNEVPGTSFHKWDFAQIIFIRARVFYTSSCFNLRSRLFLLFIKLRNNYDLKTNWSHIKRNIRYKWSIDSKINGLQLDDKGGFVAF